MTLRCRGCSLAKTPANLTLVSELSAPDDYSQAVASLADLLLRPAIEPKSSRTRLMFRDALIALDGKCVGASYREIATIIYGQKRVLTDWVGASRWMKDRIRRAHAKGEELRDGGFRDLLKRECRSG